MKKNGVAHFEIYADDTDALSTFYTTLFDWTIEHRPGMEGYGFIKTVDTGAKGVASQPGGINGGILKRPESYNARAWVNYVNVESLDASIARATELGATVTKPRSAAPGMGWFAM